MLIKVTTILTMMIRMVVKITPSFSELEIEAFPCVVHIRVSERYVVNSVVAD